MNLPIGSIIAWHKSFANTPALPPGWVECNGGTLDNMDSPYHGQTIPDLNGGGRFLRGGSVSGTLQDDSMAYHSHLAPLGGGGGSVHAGQHASTYTSKWGNGEITQGPISDGTHGAPHVDVETRPKNASVVWIMKVSDTERESRLIPIETEDVHVNAIVHSVDSQYGGKIGAQSGDPGQVSGAGGAVTGEDYAGVRVLGCWNVGKVFGGGNVGGMTSTDELKLVFSHSFLLHKLGKPFDFETCVFKRWNATTHVWDDLNAEQFQVAAKLCGGVKSSADLGVELWIKTSTAGETFLFGAVQPD